MPPFFMKLDDHIILSAEPRDKAYKLFDGEGLYVEISPTGTRYWRLKYRFEGKEKRISLGAYPEVSIEDAREHMRLCKQQLKNGTDPSQARKDSNQSITKPPSIEVGETSPDLTHQDTQTIANTDGLTDNESDISNEGAFPEDLGAFNQKEVSDSRQSQKNALEDDSKASEGNAIPNDEVMQMINELRAEIHDLRQENTLLKDQINAKESLFSDNSYVDSDTNADNSAENTDVDNDVNLQEIPKFTFKHEKTNVFLRLIGHIKAMFQVTKEFSYVLVAAIQSLLEALLEYALDAISIGLKSISALICKVRLFLCKYIKLGWLVGYIKQTLGLIGRPLNGLKLNLLKLLGTKKAKSKSEPPSFLANIASLPKIALGGSVALLSFTKTYFIQALTLIGKMLRILGAFIKQLIHIASKSPKHLLITVLVFLIPVVIYLVSSGTTSKDSDQEVSEVVTDREIEPQEITSTVQESPIDRATNGIAPIDDAPNAPTKEDTVATVAPTPEILYPYPKDNNWKGSQNYVQVDYFTYFFGPNKYVPVLSAEAANAFKLASANNDIYLVVEGFSDAVGDMQKNLITAKRRSDEFTNLLLSLGFRDEQIIGSFFDAPMISVDCIEPMCSFYRKAHVSVYVKKEVYDQLKESAKLKQPSHEAYQDPKQQQPAPEVKKPAPEVKKPATAETQDNSKVSAIDNARLNNPMPNLIDGYRLTARLTYYFGLYESTPNLDDNMVKNLKDLFSKPDQKFAIEGFENLSDDPNQDIQIAQGRAVMMKDELIKLGLSEDRILGVFYNVPQESKGCVEIGCAKGRRVVINLFNK